MKSQSLRHACWPWRALAQITACAVLTAILAGCSSSANSPVAKPGTVSEASTNDFVLPQDFRGVTTAQVKTERLPDYLDVAARIQADPTRVVRIYAPVGGRLLSVAVRPADHVVQGQTLAIVASSDVAAARAAYQQALADDQVKKRALDRARDLYQHRAVAEKDYEQAQADAQMSAAALASARERLSLLNVGIDGFSDQVTVRAPRPGVVIDLGAAAGEFSKSLDNSNPLCTIADLSHVWAVGDVYEKDLASVRLGDPVDITVNAYPGETWRGRISAIASTVDPTTRTLSVRVVLPNRGQRLKPDMFAQIRLVRAVRSFVVVPEAAILREGTSAYVFVQKSPGHFERRAVTIGRETSAHQAELTSGVSPGETIVVEGADLLRVAEAS